jgi:hypothetical protein
MGDKEGFYTEIGTHLQHCRGLFLHIWLEGFAEGGHTFVEEVLYLDGHILL